MAEGSGGVKSQVNRPSTRPCRVPGTAADRPFKAPVKPQHHQKVAQRRASVGQCAPVWCVPER